VPILLANEDGSYDLPVTRSRASLVALSDELTPQEVSARLGLEPDRWWLAGEFGSHPPDAAVRRSRPQRFNGWQLTSQLDEGAAAEAHLRDLLERIGDAAQGVALLVTDPRIHVRVWLHHHTDNSNPGLSLTPEALELLVALGAGIEIDVYVEEAIG
jgi:hypothetical protein